MKRSDLTKEQKRFLTQFRKLSASEKVTAFGNAPNLRALNRLVQRGAISAEELVLAVKEALVLKRMSARMADMIAEALADVMGVGEVIDLSAKVSAARKPTFKDAIKATLEHLKSRHWNVVLRDPRNGSPLKVPYAVDPSGKFKVWFKSQSVYAGGSGWGLNDARSVHVDLRDLTPEQFEAYLLRWMR